jgi:hypothetical protein
MQTRVDTHATDGLPLGLPLDSATRAYFEPRFGHDFGHVRVHADTAAGARAAALDAAAYTVGPDILFGPGQYAPESPVGQRLLAHELTHVAQQERFGAYTPSVMGALGAVSRRSDAAEREAEAAADLVTTGQAVQVQAAPSAAVACGFTDWLDGVVNPTYPTPVGDAGKSMFWDLASLSPIGAMASTAIDMGKWGIDKLYGDEVAANRHSHDAAWDAIGMVPGLGTLQSLGSLAVDGTALVNRKFGDSESDAPLAGDWWHNALKNREDAVGVSPSNTKELTGPEADKRLLPTPVETLTDEEADQRLHPEKYPSWLERHAFW